MKNIPKLMRDCFCGDHQGNVYYQQFNWVSMSHVELKTIQAYPPSLILSPSFYGHRLFSYAWIWSSMVFLTRSIQAYFSVDVPFLQFVCSKFSPFFLGSILWWLYKSSPSFFEERMVNWLYAHIFQCSWDTKVLGIHQHIGIWRSTRLRIHS